MQSKEERDSSETREGAAPNGNSVETKEGEDPQLCAYHISESEVLCLRMGLFDEGNGDDVESAGKADDSGKLIEAQTNAGGITEITVSATDIKDSTGARAPRRWYIPKHHAVCVKVTLNDETILQPRAPSPIVDKAAADSKVEGKPDSIRVNGNDPPDTNQRRSKEGTHGNPGLDIGELTPDPRSIDADRAGHESVHSILKDSFGQTDSNQELAATVH